MLYAQSGIFRPTPSLNSDASSLCFVLYSNTFESNAALFGGIHFYFFFIFFF